MNNHVLIIIPIAYLANARLVATYFDRYGGGGTFDVPLYNAQNEETHRWCGWYMPAEEAAGVAELMPYADIRVNADPDAVLQELSLKTTIE